MKHIEQNCILSNFNSCMALSIGVYSKDDCGILKQKDTNNTRKTESVKNRTVCSNL